MWLVFALASAGFAGATSVLAKYGIQKVDSNLAVALRTVVILAFAWLMVLITGGWADIGNAIGLNLLFLILSGVATGLSWLCYFKALQMGSVNQVAPVDKSSTALTMIGGWLFLDEPMTAAKIFSIVLILVGMLLMLEKKTLGNPQILSEAASGAASAASPGTNGLNAAASDSDSQTAGCSKRRGALNRKGWLFWAIASVVFAAATTLLSKAGVQNLNSDLALAIRTGIVLIMAWLIVFSQGTQKQIGKIERKSMLFIGLSGLSTGLSWLCYFRALADKHAQAGIVQPIDKLSILVSVVLARIFFGEKLSWRARIGLLILVAGILILLI